MKTATVIILLLATFARESLADTPSVSPLERERERVEAQRKQVFDPNNPAAQPKKGGMPTAASIERERKRIEQERKEMFDPNNPSTKNAPNTFPNIPTPARGEMDIETIAKQYEGKANARKTDEVMVFASFTMPDESLKRLVKTAGRAGAAVLFRGFKNNSLKETSKALRALQENNINVLINPNAFTKYKITAVPAVVLATAGSFENLDGNGCALPNTYVAVDGDVTLDYALEEIARRAPQFETLANRYIRQMRGSL